METSLETPEVTYYEVIDEATGITVVVECDDPAGTQPWLWYLANYPVVSREPADNEGPAGRALTKEAAVEAATKAFPTLTETADLKRKRSFTKANNDRAAGSRPTGREQGHVDVAASLNRHH